jgi:hypothetical protein
LQSQIAIIKTGIFTEAPLRVGCRDLLEHHGVSIATADVGRTA